MGYVLQFNDCGYFVDFDNGMIYFVDDCMLLLCVICEDGSVGWGEIYGIVVVGVV